MVAVPLVSAHRGQEVQEAALLGREQAHQELLVKEMLAVMGFLPLQITALEVVVEQAHQELTEYLQLVELVEMELLQAFPVHL